NTGGLEEVLGMRRLRWLVAALMAAGVLGLVAAGCGGDDSGGSAGNGSSGGGTIKIGASLPLTGEVSEPGKGAQQGYTVGEAILAKAGVKTVYRQTYTIDNANYDAIASSIKGKNADVVVNGATFEDGVGLVRSLLKVGYTPKWLYQTSAPSLGDQYAKGIGKENTEGIFYAVSHSIKAKTPGNEEFVAKYKELYGGTEVPEDAADAYAAAEVLSAAVK